MSIYEGRQYTILAVGRGKILSLRYFHRILTQEQDSAPSSQTTPSRTSITEHRARQQGGCAGSCLTHRICLYELIILAGETKHMEKSRV